MTEHTSLAAALVAALAELTIVETTRPVDAGSYSYSYADIGDVIRATRPTLAEHGIVALTPVHAHGDGLACTVTLLHASGDRLDFGPFSFPHGRDAQATGSMVTYHRRYALVAALGMAAGGDDDGATAAPRQHESRSRSNQGGQTSGGSAAATNADPPLALAADVPAMWAAAKQVDLSRAQREGDRLDHLPDALALAVIDRMTTKVASSDMTIAADAAGVDAVKSLPPAWTHTWRKVLDAAYQSLDSQQEPSGAVS